jgi:protein tyrosine/serine phosphatase
MTAADNGVSTHSGVFRTITAAFVLMSVAWTGLARDHLHNDELPKFYKVSERLYRGGQPKPGGIQKLAAMGIKTVINLRGQDEQTRAEEAEAKRAGLAYFNISMDGLGRPSHDQVSRVMAIINDREYWPVFVHCKRGSDRTGTIIAISRILNDGWTADQAMYEAKRFGLSWIEFGMKDYISDYYRDLKSGKLRMGNVASQQPAN